MTKSKNFTLIENAEQSQMKAKLKMHVSKSIQDVAAKVLNKFNLQIVRLTNHSENMKQLGELQGLRFIETRNGFLFDFLRIVSSDSRILEYLNDSQSQLLQDLFVLNELSWKEEGFFVEFGATDGKNLSNTYLLEKKFGWNGLLAEPGKNWHSLLRENRTCVISTDCIWEISGERLTFLESEYPEFSTIEDFENHDGMVSSRNAKARYEVNTLSLQDFLEKNNAPSHIDYISIDTEGSEYEILKFFPFEEYKFRVMTVEHNHSENESRIDKLLTSHGYRRIHRDISQFDAWYVNTFE